MLKLRNVMLGTLHFVIERNLARRKRNYEFVVFESFSDSKWNLAGHPQIDVKPYLLTTPE